MSEATMTEGRPGYVLLAEPEAFQDLATGVIHETYVFDGANVTFALGAETIAFAEFTVHLYKVDDDTLQNICIDVANVPVPDLRKIGAVTGMPDGAYDDAASVLVRFEMLKPALELVQRRMLTCRAFGEWLDSTDDEGLPLFWNLGNYYMQSTAG